MKRLSLPPAGSTVLQFLQIVRDRFTAVRVMQTAGALTYTTLLSLVPMITVVLTMMRQFSPFMRLGEGLRGFLLQNLLPERAGKVVATYALQFSEKASSLTVVGTLFLVVTAIMLFATIDRTINSIWAVRTPRPWFVRIPIYWLALTLGPIIFAAGIAATSDLLNAAVTQRNGIIDRGATALLLSALFVFLFHVVPNRRLTLWHAVVGGLVAGVGVVLVQKLFGLYLARLPSFTLIYGTFSVLPIFLICIYLTWLVILLGATVAAALPEFVARRRLLPASPAGRLVAVLRLAQALVLAQREGRTCGLAGLAQASGQTPAEAERLLDDMARAGWVLRSEDGAWCLRVAGERLTLGALLTDVVIGVRRDDAGAGLLSEADRALLDSSLGEVRSALAMPVLPAAYKG
ncbi:MAG: YihY family inner membrane protein [Candidatus Dactylopiibacterium sp.]|nr:YihY family inner membrane protein [Candidatus Dactylopiibacterium sp.]